MRKQRFKKNKEKIFNISTQIIPRALRKRVIEGKERKEKKKKKKKRRIPK